MATLREVLEERLQKQADAEAVDTALADEVAMFMNMGYKLAAENFFPKEGENLKEASKGKVVTAISENLGKGLLGAGAVGAVAGGGYALGREQGREAEVKEQLRQSILDRLFGPSPAGDAGGNLAPMESGMTSPYGVY